MTFLFKEENYVLINLEKLEFLFITNMLMCLKEVGGSLVN